MNKFNLFAYDDPEFPLFERKGSRAETGVFESAEGSDSVSSMAMSAVLAWIDEGDYTYGTFSSFVAGSADLDGDEEYTEDEEELFNDILAASADAFLSMGASSENVDDFLNNESDAAGEKLGKFLSEEIVEEAASDVDVIAAFAGGSAVFESGILETAFKKVRAVKDGKVIIKKKRIGKGHSTAAQRASMKIARRKANTAAAKLHRAKSMRVRKQRGF